MFSANLKKYRSRLGLSQLGLAERADLSHTFIGDAEGGRTGTTFPTLVKLAKALGVETYQLFKPEEKDGDGEKGGEVKIERNRYTDDLVAAMKIALDMTAERFKGEMKPGKPDKG